MKRRGVAPAALALAAVSLAASTTLLAQDVLHFHLSQLKLLTEDDKVRVLDYAPRKGDKTPMHSHPASVVYVVKGGRVEYTLPDGTTKIAVLKAGTALMRPAVTHADQALDDLHVILVELKQS